MVLVQSSEYLEGVYDSRKLELTLVIGEVEGLKVPVDALHYQQDTPYVTRRQTGENRPVPVNILLTDGEYAVLSQGRFFDSDGEAHTTVTLYDEILLNQSSDSGEEGQHE